MTQAANKRLEWLDFWRIVSAIAIIWLHTPESELLAGTTSFTRYAVPFFVASAAFMACRIRSGPPKVSFGAFLWSRFSRIYLPFLGWSFIYLVVRYLASFVLSNTHPFPITWSLLWRGPTSHLWFLPFILLATILANLVGRLVSARPAAAWPTVIGLLVISGLSLMEPTFSRGFSYTASLAYNTLPALFWGISLAIVCSKLGTAWLSRPLTIDISFTLFLAMEVVLALAGRDFLVENLAGFFLLLACFGDCRFTWVTAVASLGSMAYGVYLSHMLFVEGLQDVARHFGFAENAPYDIVVFVLSTVCALVLTACLQRSRHWSWLVP